MGREDLTMRAAADNDRAALEKLIGDCYSAVYPGWYGEDVLGSAPPNEAAK
jgi:hypothetical protein